MDSLKIGLQLRPVPSFRSESLGTPTCKWGNRCRAAVDARERERERYKKPRLRHFFRYSYAQLEVALLAFSLAVTALDDGGGRGETQIWRT